MFISKKNYLNVVLIVLILLGLVDNQLSIFKRTSVPPAKGLITTYIARNNKIGIYARVDIPDSGYIITSISHNYKYPGYNCLEVEDTKICDDDLLSVKYELIYEGKDRTTVFLSLDSSFHSDRYLVSSETIESEYIKAPISYIYRGIYDIFTENHFFLTVVSDNKRYTILDNFELVSESMV